ncbi:unnamed protein product, partial [Meganyctiphanes norvegica]
MNLIHSNSLISEWIVEIGLVQGKCVGLIPCRVIGNSEVLIEMEVKFNNTNRCLLSVSIILSKFKFKFFIYEMQLSLGIQNHHKRNIKPKKHQADDCVRGVSLPTLIGSGITKENVEQYMNAHGFIVGSHFKSQGSWTENLELERVKSFMDHVRILRGGC